LKDLIHAANTTRTTDPDATAVPDHVAAPYRRAFTQGVLVGLKELSGRPGDTPADFLALPTVLHTRPNDVLRFVTDLRVPPTPNQADYAEFGVMRLGGLMRGCAGVYGVAAAA
jgi:transposase